MSGIDLAPDVLVVGGGVAGAVAAARARELGKRVLVVTKPGGGTAQSSGAIDVADDHEGAVPSASFDALERGGRWRRGVDLAAAKRPHHPYAVVGAQGRDRFREATSLLKSMSGELGLTEREDGANHLLATAFGTVKRTALAQRSQVLDLATLEPDAIVAVVEPSDLAGFTARAVAPMLAWISGMSSKKLQFVPLVVGRALPERHIHFDAFDMARALDDKAKLAAFSGAFRTALAGMSRRPAYLLFPPVLGLTATKDVIAELELVAGRPVRELLALPPSVPGARLQRVLHAALQNRGVSVVEGTAVKADVDAGGDRDERVRAVHIEGDKVSARIAPKAVVLAGGKFFAGGIVRNNTAREPLFDLPVVADGVVVGDRFIGDLLGQTPEADHALWRAGIATDAQLRPVDLRRRPRWMNLFAAGSIVQGYDAARDGTGAGVGVLTGFLAGERAAQSV